LATLSSRLSRQPFAERSRSELTRHWGSIGFDSAQPTELKAWQFQPYCNGSEPKPGYAGIRPASGRDARAPNMINQLNSPPIFLLPHSFRFPSLAHIRSKPRCHLASQTGDSGIQGRNDEASITPIIAGFELKSWYFLSRPLTFSCLRGRST